MTPRHALRLWFLSAIAAGLAEPFASASVPGTEGHLAGNILAACATGAGAYAALATRDRRGALTLVPAAAAPLACGAAGTTLVWVALALIVLVRLRGEREERREHLLTRPGLMRRLMDSGFPGERAHNALSRGFAGAFEELRPAVAPIASLPPSLALPLLGRLALGTDSITRLTARKRLELALTALREETAAGEPPRGAGHAASRIHRAEIRLVLARHGTNDAEERRVHLAEAAKLAGEASDDFPGNEAYAAIAFEAARRADRKADVSCFMGRVSPTSRFLRSATFTPKLIRSGGSPTETHASALPSPKP